MPDKCSVPGCTSNYKYAGVPDSPYVPVFKLPTGPLERVQTWLRAIHRENISDVKTIFVCVKHFREEDIIKKFQILQPDGTYDSIPRKKYKLSDDAIPCIFPNCPFYLSLTQPKPVRFSRDEKDAELFAEGIKQSLEKQVSDEERYKFYSFQQLKEKIKLLALPEEWLLWNSDSNHLHFLKPAYLNDNLIIDYSMTIDTSLYVKAKSGSLPIPLTINIIHDTREIELPLNEIPNIQVPTPGHEQLHTNQQNIHIREAATQLKSAISECDNSNEDSDTFSTHGSFNYGTIQQRLQFILCQLENSILAKTRRRYNVITQVVALKMHLISPACYSYLQSLGCMCLPHPRNLLKLCSNIGLENEFSSYLETATTNFNSLQRNVIIHMDEIHIKSDISYKGGKIIGSTLDSNEPTRTVFAVMVSSLYRKWSEIVRLLPCSSTSANELQPIISRLISDIENCGLFVHVICTDNYPLNVSLFKLFSPDKKTLSPEVIHPCDSNRPLFLIFDFVHILKTIRNNWLNLKDYNRTFCYPMFEDFSVLNIASFQDIRSLYKSDQHSVIKLAPRLSAKACYPSNFERQNVNLALKVFDESTVGALRIFPISHPTIVSNTADFVNLVLNIWKIFNINVPKKDVRLKDEFSKILEFNDSRFPFLSRVVDWLECWSRSDRKGKLSAQTFTSFKHSCLALPKIVNYLTEHRQFKYVLSSRLQNDPLEHHFGLYRMMSGAQYHVSYCQILESERRIKLSHVLKLFSQNTETEKCENNSLKDFLKTFSQHNTEQQSQDISLNLEDYMVDMDGLSKIPMNNEVLQSLAFVAGYAVHAYMKSTSKCGTCLEFLTEDKDLTIDESKYQLIQIMDRGSLKWPSSIVVESIVMVWRCFSIIEHNESLLRQFSIGPSREILVQLSLTLIELDSNEDWRRSCPNCSTLGWDILSKLVTVTSNCIIANKVKNTNSVLLSSRSENCRKLKKVKLS